MNENTIYNVLITISILAIIVIAVLIFTTKTNEPFTELYFENHQSLPNKIQLNQTYQFAFTIHNMENQITSYPYSAYILVDGVSYPISANTVTLNHNQSITLQQSFNIKKGFNSAEVQVNLINKDQEIHFWVKQ